MTDRRQFLGGLGALGALEALTALGGGQIDLEWDGGQASLARRSPLGR